jgi:hypothetical protein
MAPIERARLSHSRGVACLESLLQFVQVRDMFTGTILSRAKNDRAHSPPCRADRCG